VRRYKKFDHFFANFIFEFSFLPGVQKQKYRKKDFQNRSNFFDFARKRSYFQKRKNKKTKTIMLSKKKCEFEHFF
tara:strand:+ start:283 stop:507 length:225 start_codon:yes stop_codon:yes gene_type:complete